MKTTETPAPLPAESGAGVSKVDVPSTGPAVRKREGNVLNVFSHGILVIWAIMVVLPLVWAVMTSFKDDSSIFGSPWSLPDSLHFDNWARAWTDANMSDYFLNTVLVVGGSLIGTLVLGSMAAYVLARFDFPGNRFVYYLFVGGMSFPIMLALVPLFYVVNNMGLLNTIHGLILVYIAYSLPHGLLPHGVLPHPAHLGGGGCLRRRRLARADVLPDHAAHGEAGSDQRRHLQLPGPVEPVHAAHGAQHRPRQEGPHPGTGPAGGQPGLQG
ncbi:hypothetical protein SCANM63S_05437 [Streptomyces canarius]